jgi:hypothetical protein
MIYAQYGNAANGKSLGVIIVIIMIIVILRACILACLH